MPEGFASKAILLLRNHLYSYLTSKINKFYPTCFAEARAVFAEAILEKRSKNCTAEARGSNFLEEAFAEAAAVIAEALRKPSLNLRFATSSFKRNKRHRSYLFSLYKISMAWTCLCRWHQACRWCCAFCRLGVAVLG